MKRIAIFASGKGSNAEKIINECKENVVLIVSNNPNAGVLEVARQNLIQTFVFDKNAFFCSEDLIPLLRNHRVEFIVLAGFLWMIPPFLLCEFPNKIINLHPSLLPKFGGKGMYGMNVHKAVIEAGETESGITIHYVNENYDQGEIIFQEKCKIDFSETPETLSQKIQKLEHLYFPQILKKLISE